METALYLSTQEISDIWGITKRRVQELCVNNRVPGAFRIGKMWAIPADAVKPKDARLREHIKESAPIGATIRKARRALKSLVDTAVKEFGSSGLSPKDTLQTLVVLFAARLLETVGEDIDLCLETCEDFFRYKISLFVSDQATSNIIKYISEYNLCLDDSLSWVYQFAVKRSDVFKYNDTQFFTEKYMINTLVDSVHINSGSRVVDPACGGGNFLLYSFDSFVKQAPESDAFDRAEFALNNLYGYEIDPFLARVGAFNLKFKALTYVARGRKVSIDDFKCLHPLVFYPKRESISGFLDREWEKQQVVNCDNGKTLYLIDVFEKANVVVTNPPFRTIKGMPREQKEYLQDFYPMAKCDMCNAFLERVMEVLPDGGKAAMVTQNSWMYLDSFIPLRNKVLSDYTIDRIWELGSNAFYDLSGEKANVVLVTASKATPSESHKIELGILRNMGIESIEAVLKNRTVQLLHIKQTDVLKNIESRFDMVSTNHLKSLQTNCDQYKSYAIPMQGTSTGDAKNLIDYYWKHIGDSDWVLVSKGGGYSRFEGLNSYCVKWGKDGEFIKNTKGSAIRNANYFNETQLVFSDTGTAGLNVRVLLPRQIFVASGPGIRVIKGRAHAHLAFLNSRFASFFVRLLSPKLTIAAGYIGKIPVTESILFSAELEQLAKQCLKSKKRRLTKRPNTFEFAYVLHQKGKTISDMAKLWFLEDIEDEWTQLRNEQMIEDLISSEMKLTAEDLQAIDNYVGRRVIFASQAEPQKALCESDAAGVLGYDCFPRRTKAGKGTLGTDGLIEFISQSKGLSCEKVYRELKAGFAWFKNCYTDLYVHALLMSVLKFREETHNDVSIETIPIEMGAESTEDVRFVKAWIETRFNIVHNGVFERKPLYRYEPSGKMLKREEG